MIWDFTSLGITTAKSATDDATALQKVADHLLVGDGGGVLEGGQVLLLEVLLDRHAGEIRGLHAPELLVDREGGHGDAARAELAIADEPVVLAFGIRARQ